METQHQTQGTVVKVEGERVWVETVRQSGCGGCAAKGACGTSVLDTLFSARSAPIELHYAGDVQVGDRVVLSLSERALLRQSLWAYGAPLVGFFIGALVFQPISELAGVLGAAAGLATGWWSVRHFARIERPRIEKVIPHQGGSYEMD